MKWLTSNIRNILAYIRAKITSNFLSDSVLLPYLENYPNP